MTRRLALGRIAVPDADVDTFAHAGIDDTPLPSRPQASSAAGRVARWPRCCRRAYKAKADCFVSMPDVLRRDLGSGRTRPRPAREASRWCWSSPVVSTSSRRPTWLSLDQGGTYARAYTSSHLRRAGSRPRSPGSRSSRRRRAWTSGSPRSPGAAGRSTDGSPPEHATGSRDGRQRALLDQRKPAVGSVGLPGVLVGGERRRPRPGSVPSARFWIVTCSKTSRSELAGGDPHVLEHLRPTSL